MPDRPHIAVRVGVLASSLPLVSSFIAYRAGLISSDQLVVVKQSQAHQQQDSPGLVVPQPHFETERQEPVPMQAIATTVDGNELTAGSANSNASDTHVPVGPTNSGDPSPPKADPVVTSVASKSVASQPEIRPHTETMIASSKSVVLLEAKIAKEKAKEQLRAKEKTFESMAKESFSALDQNGDGKLTRIELDDRTWARFLEQGGISNDAISFAGFFKVYSWYAEQSSLAPPAAPKAVGPK